MSEAIVIFAENDVKEAIEKYNLIPFYDSPKRKEYNGEIGFFVMQLKCSFVAFNEILKDMKNDDSTLAIFVNFDSQIVMWFFKT